MKTEKITRHDQARALGVSQPYASQLFNGTSPVTLKLAWKLSSKFKRGLEWFFNLTPEQLEKFINREVQKQRRECSTKLKRQNTRSKNQKHSNKFGNI